MRILIVTARFPQADGKGDQQRSLQFARLLRAQGHEVRVITTGHPSSQQSIDEIARVARVTRIKLEPPYRVLAATRALLGGLPAQTGWMMPPRAYAAVARAAVQSDAVIAVTIRCLRTTLPAPTVLDHVDTLSVNMAQRATLERRPLRRAGALIEARLLRRHERRVAGWVAAQLAVSPIDAAALSPHPPPIVVPLVVDLKPSASVQSDPAAIERDIDVILAGDMRYPPNRDAAQWLWSEIVPALRKLRDPVRVVVAGRAAGTLRPPPGIEVMADLPDLGAVLRRARVAAVALRRGTGTPIKLHEAARAGAAVVTTQWVADAITADVDIAPDANGFAAAIDRLLADETLRRSRVAATRASLARSSSDAVGRQLRELLAVVNVL